MIDRLEATLKRYNEIGEELSSPEIISDIKKMTLLSKERTSLEKTVEVYKEYKKVLSDIEEAKDGAEVEVFCTQFSYGRCRFSSFRSFLKGFL